MTGVNPKVIRWLETRGISPELAVRMNVYSGARVSTGDDGSAVVPRDDGNIIVFPFIEDGKVVAEKYRAANKRFSQRPNGRKTFYNSDVLSDPSLSSGDQALVITEGEIDCLSVIEAGYPFVVSVPDGAPPARDKDGALIRVPESTADINPEHDEKYRFIANNWDRLAPIKRVVLATDADEPGRRLAEEIVRRLGRVRCSFVTYPADKVVDDGDGGKRAAKDFNEVLLHFGQAEIVRMIAAAKPYPVSGLYRLSEFPEEPELRLVSSGWGRLDPFLKAYFPAFMVITGLAGAGKSTWATQFVANLAGQQGWGVAIASFEMRIKPYVTDILSAVRLGYAKEFWGREQREAADKWIESNFVFIAPDPEDDETSYDIDWLLSRAEGAVIRHGVRVLLIDPWNEIEHARLPQETSTDYTGRAIRALKSFGRRFGCLVIVVAHPTKSGVDKSPDKISLYDISDCYSSDTEVLTRRGWLAFAQVTLADEVSCFDMDSGSMCWETPSRIVKHEYRGKMAHFKGRSIDLLVTPNHRMVVKPVWPDPIGSQKETGIGRPTKWPKDQWAFARAQELTRAPFLIPVAPGFTGGAEPERINLDEGYSPDDFVDFIGWYVAEGSLAGASISISQGKQPGVGELRSLFDRMGIPVTEGASSSVGVHPLATMGTIAFYVKKRSSPAIVNWIREQCGEKSDTKKLPESVFDLSPRLKKRLLLAFIKGDGSIDPRHKRREMIATATTTSPFLRDGMQRLAVESGVSCTIGPKVQTRPHHKPSWQLSFVFGRKSVGLDLRNGHLTWEDYDGDVWCLTVPAGAFMVRRNGRPAVSGNSAHFANKADLGVVVARSGNLEHDFTSAIMVKKVRYQPDAGKPGSIDVTFDPATRLFSQ